MGRKIDFSGKLYGKIDCIFFRYHPLFDFRTFHENQNISKKKFLALKKNISDRFKLSISNIKVFHYFANLTQNTEDINYKEK